MKSLLKTLTPYLLLAALFAVITYAVHWVFNDTSWGLSYTLVLLALAAWPAWIAWRRSRSPLLSVSWLEHEVRQTGQPNKDFSFLLDTPIPLDDQQIQIEEEKRHMKMLEQYSEALNFTVNFKAILWLIYTNSQGVLDAGYFYIYLADVHTGQLYCAFCVEEGERVPEKEGSEHLVTNARIRQAIDVGLMHEHQDKHGRQWVTAPLNAGADTVGALQAGHQELETPFTPQQIDLFGKITNRTATAIDHWQTNQQLQRRAQQLESLNDVIRSINSETEIEPLLELILEKAIELLNVEAGSFMLRDENTGVLEFVVVEGPASAELVGTKLPAGTGLAGEVVQTALPIIVNNVQDTNLWFSKVDEDTEYHTRSILTVPLVHQRSVLGVLQVINPRNGALFVESDKQLLTAFAGEAAVTLENARLLQQTDEKLQNRVRELTLLQNLDRDLNRTLDVRSAVERTLNWIVRLFNATAGAIAIFDEGGELIAVEYHGYVADFSAVRFKNVNEHPGLMGKVMRSGKPFICGDVQELDEYHEGNPQTRSQMTLPIKHEDVVIGAATLESDVVNAFGQDELSAAERLMDHITVAINNALLYEAVKAANLAKSEFVSMVSHELKTPLTSIRGYTDLMMTGLTGPISDRQKEYMETIINNVARMMGLIKDLTDISRMDTGQLSVNLEPMPFANVMSETLASVQALADEKDIRIHLEMPTDLPLVMGDHSRLVQVLTNLMSNACKYSPPKTNVQVMVRRDELLVDGQETGVIRCAVKDSGYGIAPEDQEKLFTKFFRSQDPNVRMASGTGLGLFITKGIIEMHGGELTFESALGEGTTFEFYVAEATAVESEFQKAI